MPACAVVDHWITPLWVTHASIGKQFAEVTKGYRYAVVHFNHGLHGWPKDRTPEGSYEPAMRRYLPTVRQAAGNAKLIWASTTPITVKGNPGRLDPTDNPAILRHNAIAARLMKENGIAVNDLYGLVVGKAELARGDRFHCTAAGSKLLGVP